MRSSNRPKVHDMAESLSPAAWLFLAIAVLPQVLVLAGRELTASIFSCMCFPVVMGPFALVHTLLLVNRLGFVSNMAWISAILFSMIWFALLSWLWRKNKTVTLAICSLSFIVSAELIWIVIMPQA